MFVITVTRPTLTEEERVKRMNEVKSAAVKLVLATEKKKGKKNVCKN